MMHRLAMTSYRGVKYECQQGGEEVHGTFSLSQSHPRQVIIMEALQVVGLTSIGCVTFIGMIYGELILLTRV